MSVDNETLAILSALTMFRVSSRSLPPQCSLYPSLLHLSESMFQYFILKRQFTQKWSFGQRLLTFISLQSHAGLERLWGWISFFIWTVSLIIPVFSSHWRPLDLTYKPFQTRFIWASYRWNRPSASDVGLDENLALLLSGEWWSDRAEMRENGAHHLHWGISLP